MERPLPAMLSCFGKLRRAHELFGQIADSTGRFREGDYYEIVRSDNAHAATDPFVRVQWSCRVLKHAPEDWAYLTGDAVNNMRSALDHALAEVARVEQGMTDEQVKTERLQFPICDDSRKFDREAKKLRRCLGQDVIDKLEALQPYHRDSDDHVDDLAMLRDLSKSRQTSSTEHRHPRGLQDEGHDRPASRDGYSPREHRRVGGRGGASHCGIPAHG